MEPVTGAGRDSSVGEPLRGKWDGLYKSGGNRLLMKRHLDWADHWACFCSIILRLLFRLSSMHEKPSFRSGSERGVCRFAGSLMMGGVLGVLGGLPLFKPQRLVSRSFERHPISLPV